MYFLDLEMTATGFGLVHTISNSCLCVCRVSFPTWFLSLTNKVDNQFCLICLTTFQSSNFYHPSISIFDSRQRSVYIDSTIKNKMTIETSISSQVGKNTSSSSRPYFQCVHHRPARETPSTTLFFPPTGIALNWIPGTDNFFFSLALL